jgi:integrase/recombinase XerD
MKKKVILRRILHYNDWRYGIFYDFSDEINAMVRSIQGATYSKTYNCWHVPCDESTLKRILYSLKDIADVDISSISLPSEKKAAEQVRAVNNSEVIENISEVPENFTGSETIRKDSGRHRKSGGYDPVSFSINESNGRLIIRFLGTYDRDWIRELRSYGKLDYDRMRKEWSLRWSQMTVDSLADYFMERGISIRVEKPELPEVIREKRNDDGSKVRERLLGTEALEGIEHVTRYMNENRYSRKTVVAYMSMLELFLKYYYRKLPSQITEKDISDFFHDFIFSNSYSASYQSQMVSAIKIFFSLNGKENVNISNLGRPRTGRSLPKVFSKEEVVKILNSPQNLKHKLMLWMVYSCGLRRSEVTNIRLRDLDRDRGILNVIEAKGMVDRIVPVPGKVWIRIDEYVSSYRPVIYLFEGQSGGRYSSESVYRVFKDALRKAGIEKEVGVHSLRHSYATHLHESGLDIKYIQELLGHKDSRTTEIYTHVSRRNLITVRSPIEDLDLE